MIAETRLPIPGSNTDTAILPDALSKPAKLEPGENAHIKPVIDGTGIISNTADFTAFFKEGCEASPIIPMLTLNSGVCGSLMTLVKMFEDDGSQTRLPGGRQPFDAGGAFFTRLKLFSTEYLKACGFQFQPLNATNENIRMLLTHATKTGHLRPVTFGSKLLAAAKAG